MAGISCHDTVKWRPYPGGLSARLRFVCCETRLWRVSPRAFFYRPLRLENGSRSEKEPSTRQTLSPLAPYAILTSPPSRRRPPRTSRDWPLGWPSPRGRPRSARSARPTWPSWRTGCSCWWCPHGLCPWTRRRPGRGASLAGNRGARSSRPQTRSEGTRPLWIDDPWPWCWRRRRRW